MSYNPYDNIIEGWMNEDELMWLYNNALNKESVVEIGSWKGRSTQALLEACKGTVTAVDHFKGNPDQLDVIHKEATERDISKDFYSNVGYYKNLNVLKMSSEEASKCFADETIDMVFIDGTHTKEGLKSDILSWKPKCKNLLCGHDYQMMLDFIPELEEELNIRFEWIGYSSIYVIKERL